MTRRNGPRFTDSKDFDDVHDMIMADVIKNPERYIEKTFGGWPIKTPIDTMGNYQMMREQRHNVVGEGNFNGSFPDIKLQVDVSYNHYVHAHYDKGGVGPGELHYSLICTSCRGRLLDLFNIPIPKITERAKEIGEEKAYQELWSQAWTEASKLGGRTIKTSAGTIYHETGSQNPICFSVSYFLFIEIKSHIKSFGETLRQLRIYQSLGEKFSSPGPSNEEEIQEFCGLYGKWGHYNSRREIKPVFNGVFLLTPDIRFKDEFESQGFPVIPYVMPATSGSRKLDDFGQEDTGIEPNDEDATTFQGSFQDWRERGFL